MTVLGTVSRFLFPVLVMAIAVVLFCFYLKTKKKRGTRDTTVPTTQHGRTPSVLHTISLPEDQAEEDRHYDRPPPRYSTVDPPPPYSLFDPKLTCIWPGGAPPAYEMYPITLPLAPHWSTSTGPPTPPSSPTTRNQPQPQTLRRASTS